MGSPGAQSSQRFPDAAATNPNHLCDPHADSFGFAAIELVRMDLLQDPLDSEDFDPVQYINQRFPTGKAFQSRYTSTP